MSTLPGPLKKCFLDENQSITDIENTVVFETEIFIFSPVQQAYSFLAAAFLIADRTLLSSSLFLFARM